MAPIPSRSRQRKSPEQGAIVSAGDHQRSQLSVVSCPRNHFYRTLEQILISRRLAAVRSVALIATQVDHRRNLADQLDLEAL
jgi:hypothetical protein